jgi:hypothetical protein
MSTNIRQGEIIRPLTRKYQRQQRKISDQTDSNRSSIVTWYLPNRSEHYYLPLPIKGFIHAKYEVTSVDLPKTGVFWDAIPCRLAKSYRRFEGIVLSPSPGSIDKRRDAELLDFEDEFLTIHRYIDTSQWTRHNITEHCSHWPYLHLEEQK